eukprot:maker-scaffold1333_size47127-snap-gene-0.8 protein:Tk10847 transcript:maker-scaffold1333_size47127-snap-gene-0.8-mRNA-1 annotation:"hypothetical protein SINV_15999"
MSSSQDRSELPDGSQLPPGLFRPRSSVAASSSSSTATSEDPPRSLARVDFSQARDKFVVVHFLMTCCKPVPSGPPPASRSRPMCPLLGRKLNCECLTTATAACLFHKFTGETQAADYDPYLMAAACIYLAGKIEGSDMLKIRDIINVVHATLQPRSQPLFLDREYYAIRESLTQAELLVLRVVGFHVRFDHAHQYLLAYLPPLSQWLGSELCDSYPLAPTAWTLLQDAYQDPRVLRVPAPHLALGALALALESYGLSVPGFPDPSQPWFKVFSPTASRRQIWEAMIVIMEVYDQERTLIGPITHKAALAAG